MHSDRDRSVSPILTEHEITQKVEQILLKDEARDVSPKVFNNCPPPKLSTAGKQRTKVAKSDSLMSTLGLNSKSKLKLKQRSVTPMSSRHYLESTYNSKSLA